jgi:hypothetical protein
MPPHRLAKKWHRDVVPPCLGPIRGGGDGEGAGLQAGRPGRTSSSRLAGVEMAPRCTAVALSRTSSSRLASVQEIVWRCTPVALAQISSLRLAVVAERVPRCTPLPFTDVVIAPRRCRAEMVLKAPSCPGRHGRPSRVTFVWEVVWMPIHLRWLRAWIAPSLMVTPTHSRVLVRNKLASPYANACALPCMRMAMHVAQCWTCSTTSAMRTQGVYVYGHRMCTIYTRMPMCGGLAVAPGLYDGQPARGRAWCPTCGEAWPSSPSAADTSLSWATTWVTPSSETPPWLRELGQLCRAQARGYKPAARTL